MLHICDALHVLLVYRLKPLPDCQEQQQNKHHTNFLTFGTSRRTYEYGNNGNSSVIVRKPDESLLSNQKLFESQVCVLLWYVSVMG